MIKILIIEDDQLLVRTLELELREMGHETRAEHTFGQGLSQFDKWQPNLVLMDVHLPDQDDLVSLPELCASHPDIFIVVMTGDPDNNVVMEAMMGGAFDFLRKPLELEEVEALVNRVDLCAEKDTRPVSINIDSKGRKTTLREIVGASPPIIQLLKNIGLLTRTRIPVLVEGESGTGKELVARILHNKSCPEEPFVAINCSAIVSTLLESELFGHEKGAFTGAEQTKIGKLQFAEKGTVFLDEIGDMPFELQGKLLRVLQEEDFVRVGGLRSIPLEAKIIAASNQDLKKLIKNKRFREDLYYRLAVSKLEIPALRDRREDIPLLVNYCLGQISHRLNCRPVTIDQSAMAYLEDYHWPGNIRELENILTRAVALSKSSVLTCEDIGPLKKDGVDREIAGFEGLSLEEVEIRHIRRSLRANNWHITNTARQLGISQTTLRNKINKHDIRPSTRQSDPLA
jgi:two-component system response regulator AtoC